LPEWLRVTQGYYLLLFAMAVMVMMAFAPSGIMGIIDRAIRAWSRRRAPGASQPEAASP